MSRNADTPNLRQFPLIPFLLSSFPFLRLARHHQLQQFLFRIAAHRHFLTEMSRIVRLVSHPQHHALARTGRFPVIIHTRTAARGMGIENHQGAVARVLQDELRRLLLPPVKTTHVRFRPVGLHCSLRAGLRGVSSS